MIVLGSAGSVGEAAEPASLYAFDYAAVPAAGGTWTDADKRWQLTMDSTSQESEEVGPAFALVDLDANGMDDLLVGAPFDEEGLGAVYVVPDVETLPASQTPYDVAMPEGSAHASWRDGLAFSLDARWLQSEGCSVTRMGLLCR